MTNLTMKQKPNNDLMGTFYDDVKKYLGFNDGFPLGDPARWLLDSFQLINANLPSTYGDYSFMVVPVSKALEYWIFKIAKDLNIEINSDKVGTARDQIESHINKALDGVEKKLGNNIKTDIAFLRIMIQEYRNDIVHCEKKIENIAMAKSKVFSIYERINSVTNKLIDANLLSINS